jgi:protein gp37
MQKFLNERYGSAKAPPHMWFGVSVENRQACSRIAHLHWANAGVRFLSVEPLIEALGRVDLKGIYWVIVGGESGPKARPIDPQWVIDIRDQCLHGGVAFFFKQWGGRSPKSAGRLLEGREWNQFPANGHGVGRGPVRAIDLLATPFSEPESQSDWRLSLRPPKRFEAACFALVASR